MIRLNYGISPEKLSDEKWCRLYAEWLYTNKVEHLNMKAAILAALTEVLKHIPNNGIDNDTMDIGAGG